MKYIISENKLETTIIRFLNNGYGDMKPREDNSSIFFFKDKKILMAYDKVTGVLWVDVATIWEDLKSWFPMIKDGKQLKPSVAKWIKEYFGLEISSPDKIKGTYL